MFLLGSGLVLYKNIMALLKNCSGNKEEGTKAQKKSEAACKNKVDVEKIAFSPPTISFKQLTIEFSRLRTKLIQIKANKDTSASIGSDRCSIPAIP